MSEFGERRDRLEWQLGDRQLDLLLVTDLTNVRYLTGFPGTNGLCLIGAGHADFITDFRYVELAKAQVVDWELTQGRRDLLEDVVQLVQAVDGESLRLGFDDIHMPVRQHWRLRELMPDRIELVPAAGIVEHLREVKSAVEVAAIAAAAELADEIYRWVIGQHGLAGRTEREVARAVEMRAIEHGAAMSFPPIVAAGANGALPHAEPRDVEIGVDQLLTIDMGCLLDGYCSDCTRTFALGDPPRRDREVYELVARAQQAALDAVAPDVACADVDAAARDLIDAAGHAQHFGHGTGHGVGLEVHEGPRIAPKVPQPLAVGNVITIEPGVYLPGECGVRIEDLVVVGDDGPQVLTGISKQLTVV